MNYRHVYHAGGFGDVVKHTLLTLLLTFLARKPAPFCYIDTHAGAGYYDLFSEFASKTKEYVGGIEKIIEQKDPPPFIKHYLDCVHQINNRLTHAKFASLRYYPGSPLIARYLIRPHDRIIACELQTETYQSLRAALGGDVQVGLHHLDGLLGLKALLPPKERRGLVLIDPPYEDPEEFTRIAKVLPLALKRWETGIYAIWYPIKGKKQLEHFYRAIKQNIFRPALAVEFTIYPDLPHHLNGCGLLIINPPWQLDAALTPTLAYLWKSLTINKQGGFCVRSLKSL